MADVLEDLRLDWELRYGAARTEAVELGRVRDYLLAMDEPADILTGDMVPALFLLTLGRSRRPQPPRGSSVNAGDDFEFLHPVRVGDIITTTRRLLGIETKQGKVGTMYLLRADVRYVNQHGTTVASARQNLLRWGW